MPERAIHFSVGRSSNKQRGAIWKCWMPGHDEVYVTCRELQGALKLSLYRSGQWHVAFDSVQFQTMFEKAVQSEDRFLGKWHRPEPLGAGLTLACRVHTPWNASTIEESSLDPKVFWMTRPLPNNRSKLQFFYPIGFKIPTVGLLGTRWVHNSLDHSR